MYYLKFDNLDLNTVGSATDAVSIGASTTAAAQFRLTTGSIGSTVITIEGSQDGAAWDSVGTTITSDSTTSAIDATRWRYLRGRVSTAAGAAATGSLSFVAK